ncbi:hypothetical protein [Frankia sp. R82]|uniref:hypothetical protein n=1 Tax=Frankia sp. R82 TaxID=2950553 RepID=UPI002043636C|nr:hypothetical protein [Frankia sp. R82]MCM3882503.1 hypothetical protein [Frankia sp. R82]
MSTEIFNLPELLLRLPAPLPDGANPRLREFFEADQNDRRDRELPPDVADRDRQRRIAVMSLLETGQVRTAADFHHAAMIFQHGHLPEHNHLGFELARKAADAGHPGARWLAAAAMDRWLMRKGLPQRFGTQYVGDDKGSWTLYQVDPATTDEERIEWSVPTLATAYERLAVMNEEKPD